MAFGKLGESARMAALATSMALAPMTAAIAQEVDSVITQTTFASKEEAARYAESQGMVLARAYNGQMRIVTPELAQLLDNQGFRYGNDGILYGYEAGAIFEGFNFKRDAEIYREDSVRIRIEEPEGDNEGGNGNGGDDGCEGGCDEV